MKLHLTQSERSHLVTGYGDDYIEINKKRYKQQVIVTAEEVDVNWTATNFDSLTPEHFITLLALKPEVVLLGTGRSHRFIHPKLVSSLTDQNIAIECMSTDAACRTYNILMSEGRNVVAALLL